MKLAHEFVEFFPEELQEGIVYISIPCATVAHKCCCGCGNEVVVPLSPVAWRLTFDGDSISLWPSFGNWSLPCSSHYIIEKSQIRWCRQWTQEEIAAGREAEVLAASNYYDSKEETV